MPTLGPFHPIVREWFAEAFGQPTRAQTLGWASIGRGDSTLLLAPTGSGKTLAAFLWCLDRLLFSPQPPREARCRVLYISPLKALAVDVERNLRGPLTGIAEVAARRGDVPAIPTIAVRTGDTPPAERARFLRDPADILITTPESLYLLLTSNARDRLRHVDTVIVDEIHALVPTKRGAHLAISLERLEALTHRPPQRIGLSATQRPLDEVARFLGGVASAGRRRPRRIRGKGPQADLAAEFSTPGGHPAYRPVTIVDAGQKKALALRIEAPVSGASGAAGASGASGAAGAAGGAPSVWAAIHPRLLELVRGHRSTLIFVNSRRLAERLAGALNELAGETLVRSHHGSLAREQRLEVESLLKAGGLRGLVATSSLELGIDMGAIDLVVQIEAPPSVASGLQRIGRGGHHVDAVSEGVIFPKFRGDLLACAAVTRAMRDGAVEAIRYPRNPLDVVAQQVVAMTAMDEWRVDDLFATIRGAAPCASLSRRAFEGVLDMLSGRYPSDAFADLRPRVTWDRRAGTIVAREGAKRVAVTNGGTIPDRGLYGVFLAGAPRGAARVGELDEEMVFETKVGDTFVLGASSWYVEAITQDRVLVTPAPGAPGRMPFWKGDRAGRPLDLGLAIGRLTHDLLAASPSAAATRLTRDHDLDPKAADHLLAYLREQRAATRAVPDDSTIVVERLRDEYGDWRLCVLSPRGGRVHAPWAMAAAARIRERAGIDAETLWGDDGFVVRLPDMDAPPDPDWLLPDPDEIQALVSRQLGATPLFAARFRENAARSLLLPRHRPGRRAPLWQQRKRAADLLGVAAGFGSFPVLLETYRECLRDVFDMPALQDTLAGVRRRTIQVVTVDTDTPSPFAATLLFGYVANFLYDGDAPLAERRAQALAVDQGQLRDLLGDTDLRDLLDLDAIDAVERQAQRLEPGAHARTTDGVHDMLIALGDLSHDELRARTEAGHADGLIDDLLGRQRIVPLRIGGDTRYVAVEDAARIRDALGVALPDGLPPALLEPVADPRADLAGRYARTHAPFTSEAFARRFGLPAHDVEALLGRLATDGRLVEGAFTRGVSAREWTNPDVLRAIRRRSLARLRHEVEPVDAAVLGRFSLAWHAIHRRRRGADALLDVVERLQGVPLAASILETDLLPARLAHYDPADLDAVMAAGEVVWVGVESIGDRDGRIALYLADAVPSLLPEPRPSTAASHARRTAVLETLKERGASFFAPLHEAVGGGYPAETVSTLWDLAWEGLVTNDTVHVLRAFGRVHAPRRARRREPPAFRSRRLVPPMAEGRWSLVPMRRARHGRESGNAAHTAWATAIAQQVLDRHGVVTREAMTIESIPGGFSAIYPVLRGLEERGRIRRGYFVAGLGASQFALPGAVDLLRSLRQSPASDTPPEVAVLAATDPANPYGAALRVPAPGGRQPGRVVGAHVVLVDGALAAFVARGERLLLTWLPEAEPDRSRTARAVATTLIERARAAAPTDDPDAPGDAPRGMLLEEIDGVPAASHALAPFLTAAGFSAGALGLRATFER